MYIFELEESPEAEAYGVPIVLVFKNSSDLLSYTAQLNADNPAIKIVQIERLAP